MPVSCRFAFWLALLGGLAQTSWILRHLRLPLRHWLASSSSWAISLLGIESHTRDTTVFAGSFAAQIVPDCDGLVLVVLFLAAVLSFPTRPTLRQIAPTLAGLAIVVALNWVRVFALVLTGYFDRSILEFSHVYIWQGVLIFGTVLVWIAWANYALRLEQRDAPA